MSSEIHASTISELESPPSDHEPSSSLDRNGNPKPVAPTLQESVATVVTSQLG